MDKIVYSLLLEHCKNQGVEDGLNRCWNPPEHGLEIQAYVSGWISVQTKVSFF